MSKLIPLAGAVAAIVLAIPVLVMTGVAVAAAAAVRWLAAQLSRPHLSWPELLEFDPVLGWRPRARLKERYLTAAGDGIFSIITGPDGWPGDLGAGDADAIVIGDSFAFGYGVEHRQAFARVAPNSRVKPVGAPGYNMAQAYLALRGLGSAIDHKMVVWLICIENDLADNLHPAPLGRPGPFLRETAQRWEVVTQHVRPGDWSLRAPDYTQWLIDLFRLTPRAQRAYAACEYLIEQAQNYCESRGADLVVLTVPNGHQLRPDGAAWLRSQAGAVSDYDPGRPDREIAEMCRRHSVHFVGGAEHLSARHYKRYDPHWNASGHRVIARLISQLMSDRAGRARREPARLGRIERRAAASVK